MNSRVVPLKHLAEVRISNVDKKEAADEVRVRLVNYTDVYYEDRISPSMELMTATASRSQIEAFGLQPSDVLITKDSESANDIGVPAYVECTAPDIVCGYHLAILRPRSKRIDGRFVYWAMNSEDIRGQIESAATGITRFGLRKDTISQVKLRVPPYSMQRAIANHLDTETARIDALISNKHRMLDVLAERLRVVITSAMSGNLTTSGGTATSASHQVTSSVHHSDQRRDRRPLRAYAEIHLGRQRSPQNHTGPHMTAYLRAANVKDGKLDLSDIKSMHFTPAEQARFELQPGDILVSEGSGSLAAIGASAVWNCEIDGTVCFQNTLLRLRPRSSTDPRFLAWWCRYAYADGIFANVATGANIFHLSADRVRSLPMAHFPLAVQRTIADRLDIEAARIDGVVERERRILDLLVERRQALITAAVTGDISVPGLAA